VHGARWGLQIPPTPHLWETLVHGSFRQSDLASHPGAPVSQRYALGKAAPPSLCANIGSSDDRREPRRWCIGPGAIISQNFAEWIAVDIFIAGKSRGFPMITHRGLLLRRVPRPWFPVGWPFLPQKDAVSLAVDSARPVSLIGVRC